jgi:hypothetical protein
MMIGKLFGNVFKAALLCAGIYVVLNWESIRPGGGEVEAFARKACIDEIGARFDTKTVRAYEVTENNSGYVVRASATLAKGPTAKVVCLTNSNGGVREVMIDEK